MSDTENLLNEASNLAKYGESYSSEFKEYLERKTPQELEKIGIQEIVNRLSEICEKYRSLIAVIQGTDV